jgi:hypothetical protein
MSSKLPQFHQAWSALQKENTSEFNKSYGYISPPGSRPSTPKNNLKNSLKKTPSQYNLAKLSINQGSPLAFNEAFGFLNKKRKSRKNRKNRRATRKARRSH